MASSTGLLRQACTGSACSSTQQRQALPRPCQWPQSVLRSPSATAQQALNDYRAARSSLRQQTSVSAACLQSVSASSHPLAAHHAGSSQSREAPLQQLQSLLQRSVSIGKAPDAEACNELLKECARSANWPAVWACYAAVETCGVVVSASTYTALWRAAVEAGWLRQGVELFRRCAAVWGVPSLQAYTTLIAKLLSERRLQKGLPGRQLAHAVWQELRDAHGSSLDPAAVRAGVAALCGVNRLEEASELMRRAARVGMQSGLGSYNRLIMGHCERGEMVEAQRVFARLSALYCPDAVTWNTLAWGYARLGDVVSTRGIMAQAAIMKTTPDAITWSTLIHAYVRAGDMEGAEDAMSEARVALATARLGNSPSQTQQQPDSDRQTAPDSSTGPTYTSQSSPPTPLPPQSATAVSLQQPQRPSPPPVVSSQGSGAQPAGAAPHQQPQAPASPWPRVAASTASPGLRDLPPGLAELSARILRPPVPRAGTPGAGRLGEPGGLGAGFDPCHHMYGSLIDGYMRLGRPEDALRVVRRMRQETGLRCNLALYNTLIRGFVKLGIAGQSQALELFNEMRAVGVRPDAHTYTLLLRGLADSSVDAPYTAPNTAPTPSYPHSDIDIDIPQQDTAYSDGFDVAMPPASAANGVNRQPQQPTAGTSTDSAFVITDDRVQQQGRAGLLSSAGVGAGTGTGPGQPAGSSTSGPQQGTASVSGIGSVPLYELAGTAQLRSLLRAMHTDGIALDSAVFTTLMITHARAGRHELALRVFRELEASATAVVDVIALNALTAVYVAAGRMGEATQAAERAAALAAQQRQPAPEAAYGALVKAYARDGDLGSTLRTLKRFLVLGGRPGRRVLDPVVRLCMDMDQTENIGKILRAAELTGVEVDRERYQRWLMERRQRHRGRSSSPPPPNPTLTLPPPSTQPATDQLPAPRPPTPRPLPLPENSADNAAVERVKWWLGLPSTYYKDEWQKPVPGSRRSSASDTSIGIGVDTQSRADDNSGHASRHPDSAPTEPDSLDTQTDKF